MGDPVSQDLCPDYSTILPNITDHGHHLGQIESNMSDIKKKLYIYISLFNSLLESVSDMI